MKGIILAGGKGTRLNPITIGISKQLLPIYDKPMIYYPLSTLMLADIREVLIISSPEHIDIYKDLLGNGKKYGIEILYEVQKKPRGLADAFIIGEKFIGNDSVCLILGDNVFYGQGMAKMLKNSADIKNGANIFGYYVNNPSNFGVVEIDKKMNVLSLKEKPKNSKSNYAIPGLYFYDNTVIEKAKKVIPSQRGEIEITDINNSYLKDNQLKVKILGRGFTWLDTGTFDGLSDASNFVKTIQKRTGLYISCIEEIAYSKNWISKRELNDISKKYLNEYGRYLRSL